MNNQWNRLVYKGWAPVYDHFFNKGPFAKARKNVFQSLSFQKGQKVLLVGVGTGADLDYIPVEDLDITAIDYSPEMLERARQRFSHTAITYKVMDAQQLELASDSFDYVIASLIVSVVPDSEKAFAEMQRVVKPGGQIVIFDKFAKRGERLSLGKKLIRPVVGLLGTDIGVSFEKLYEGKNDRLELLEDKDVIFRGMYRRILLKKSR